MRWFSIVFFVAVLAGLLSVIPAAAQTMTPTLTPTPQPGDDFWLDGPYEMGSTGAAFHIFDEIYIPPIANNPIVGVGFKNFKKTGGKYVLAKLAGSCGTAPCLQVNSSPRQLIANGVYCKTGIVPPGSIYKPNCAALFPGYNDNFIGVSHTGTAPRWDGGYLELMHEEEGGITRTWSIEVYIIRFGKRPLNALFDATPTLGVAPLTVEFENLSTPEHYITSYAWDFGDGACVSGCTSGAKDPPPYTYHQCGNYVVRLTITGENDDTDYYELSILVKCEGLEYPRPLKLMDEQRDADVQALFDSSVLLSAAENDLANRGYYFSPVLRIADVYTVHAVSKKPDAYVHSITSGRVESIKPLTWFQCAYNGTVFYNGGIQVEVQPNDAEEPYCRTQLINNAGDHSDPFTGFFKPFYLDVRDMYVVTISLDLDKRLVYVVKDAPLYITVGDTVNPECVLGKTAAVISTPSFSVNFLSGLVDAADPIVSNAVSLLASGGAAAGWGLLREIIHLLDMPSIEYTSEYGIAYISLFEVVEIVTSGNVLVDMVELDLLTKIGAQYPTEDNFCNSDPRHSDCVTRNSQMMNNGEGWQTDSSVLWTNPGVILGPNETISQTLVLDPSTTYSLTIEAHPTDSSDNGVIRLFLGQTLVNGISLQPSSGNYDIPAGYHQPDAGAFYTAGVQNTGNVPVEVMYICVTDGAPSTAPGGCYFSNSSFDYGTSGWIASGGVLASDGAVILPFGASISQNVRLLPDGDNPHTYLVQVIYQGYFTEDPDPTDIEYVMQWQWPGDAGFEDFGPENPDPRTMINASFTIEVTEQGEGLMTFAPDFTASNSTLIGIRVFSICMGGPFPGQETGTPPPFESKCTINTQPQGNEFGPWLRWHWGNLDSFYNCELMPFLNRLYKRIDQGITLMSWQARYWQAVAVRWGSWLSTDLLPWLNGHFANMAGGRVTNVNQTCNNLFCLLTSLIEYILAPIVNLITSILGQAAALLFSIITALFSIFLALIGEIFKLFGWLQELLFILINSWNSSTPTPIPGLPSCAIDPKSNGFCIALWMMENTVFSGTIGQLFIPLIIGITSIHLLLYVIGELKKTLLQLGQVV